MSEFTDGAHRLPASLRWWAGKPRDAAAGVSRASSAPRAAFITALYADFLSRQPSADDLAFWSARLAAGAPRRAIADGFANSDEYRTIRIGQAYQTVLGRTGEPAGIANWLDAMRRGAVTTENWMHPDLNSTRPWLTDEIYGSTEAARRRVSTIYDQFLGRIPDEAGLQFWATVDLSRGDSAVRAGFTASDEYYQRASARFA